ncbi:phage major capsid protein [Priestia megaterium]|uniref:phage major capsid protein n=1 Tax=Priestia megaterium TaxID=1404 RepID=UPI000BFD5360|nr:phage major capsid protein [Priestia megaterium]PGR01344.1 phage major capsid protein [Priestia megaterium]
MTIKFKSEAYNDAKQKLSNAYASGDVTAQGEALTNFVDAMKDEVSATILQKVQNENADNSILASRGQNVLTSNELKFFNAVVEQGGFTTEETLPVTTQERIFEDLTKEHPLLAALGLQNMGAVTRYIYSDPSLNYAWGELFGDIKGQVNASFRSEQVGTLKLTAFAAIPKDMVALGPVWVENYVRTLLVESYSVGLEYGFVNGNGITEPLGLTKDKAENGAVTDKVSSGTLTFAPSERGQVIVKELHGVVSALSVDSKGKQRKVLNNIVMVVNPIDAIAIQARNTIQTATGQWVTALPYNIQVVESEEVPLKKAIFFVKGCYNAALTGGYTINKYDQILAFEDANLYTIKQFANGRAKDNKSALVYDLNIDFDADPAGA